MPPMPSPFHFTGTSTSIIPPFRISLPLASTFVPLDQSLWIEGPSIPQLQEHTYTDASSLQELDILSSPLYEEYFTAENLKPITPLTNVNAEENNTDQVKDARFEPYEFINPLCTPVQEVAESSSRNVDTSNMHTFYQRHRSNYHWTKDY
ncbi:hypothetical protein Tco_0732026 [Tanacetum coccineum]